MKSLSKYVGQILNFDNRVIRTRINEYLPYSGIRVFLWAIIMKVELSHDEIETILFQLDCALYDKGFDRDLEKTERIALAKIYIKFEQLAKESEE
jgi:hypothetical protein